MQLLVACSSLRLLHRRRLVTRRALSCLQQVSCSREASTTDIYAFVCALSTAAAGPPQMSLTVNHCADCLAQAPAPMLPLMASSGPRTCVHMCHAVTHSHAKLAAVVMAQVRKQPIPHPVWSTIAAACCA